MEQEQTWMNCKYSGKPQCIHGNEELIREFIRDIPEINKQFCNSCETFQAITPQNPYIDMDIPKKLGINETDFRLVFGSSKVDYDPDKDQENIQEHEYSLKDAVPILTKWLLPPITLSPTPFITYSPIEKNDEIRHQHMGLDEKGKVVFMVTTMRPNETVRIISFRCASRNERDIFYLETGYKDL